MLLAQFSLPETIVTNNEAYFVSEEFEGFLNVNGIKHITSAPTTQHQMDWRSEQSRP